MSSTHFVKTYQNCNLISYLTDYWLNLYLQQQQLDAIVSTFIVLCCLGGPDIVKWPPETGVNTVKNRFTTDVKWLKICVIGSKQDWDAIIFKSRSAAQIESDCSLTWDLNYYWLHSLCLYSKTSRLRQTYEGLLVPVI